MKKSYYITTPIYYVNDKPHIGHVYTTVAADVLARYKRLSGYDTFFLTGTDEHGQKIQEAAEKKGISPLEHADSLSQSFRDAWAQFNITYDRFIRTTEKEHEETVSTIVQRLMDSGDIYLGDYEGWYNPSDEEFVPANQVKDGKDATTGRELVFLKEQSYFFALSKYQDRLEEMISSDKSPSQMIPNTSFMSGWTRLLTTSQA
jgi:methionyl-tRNA synthetase